MDWKEPSDDEIELVQASGMVMRNIVDEASDIATETLTKTGHNPDPTVVASLAAGLATIYAGLLRQRQVAA